MNGIQIGILTLIRSAVTGQSSPLPADFRLEEAEKLIISHQIVGLAYEGAVLCGIQKSEPVMGRLFQLYCQILFRSNMQLKAVDTLLSRFEESGVDHLPVKGCLLKHLYPNPAMRVMTDADILIRMEQYDAVRAIVTDLGYTEGEVADHAFVWKGKTIELELHRRLVPTTDADYYSYIGTGWQRAVHQQGHRYGLRPEDMYLFLFVHFTKHYRGGGIGLRQAVDLWVWHRAYPDMDRNYLARELEKLGLTVFHSHIMAMLDMWFEEAAPTERTAFISQFIFDSGSWGTKAQRSIFEGYANAKKTGSAKTGRLRAALEMVFPGRLAMAGRYPVLHKAPWLLPFLWPVRWVTALLFRRQNIRSCREKVGSMTAENIDSFQQSLEYVGLS